MEYIDILIIVASLILIIGLISNRKILKRHLIFISLSCVIAYSFLRPFCPLGVVGGLGTIAYLVFITIKSKKKVSIKLLEVEFDNAYIQEFINNYKKDIYSFFPFYQAEKGQRSFLMMLNADLAGILIAYVKGKEMFIEVDYAKPTYRNKIIGKYIYKQNTGYFKKLGVNKLLTKSYHKGHSKYLQKMGFEQINLDNQLFFVKNLD